VLWFSRVFSLFSSIKRLTASFTPLFTTFLSSSPPLHMNLTAFLHALLSHTFHFFRHAITVLLFVITFMHCIYSYITEKKTMFIGYIVLQLFCNYDLWYV
jgi:hypothetical protein